MKLTTLIFILLFAGNASGQDTEFTSDFLLSVQKGLMPGHSLIHKFGRNNAVANGSWEGVNQHSTAFVWLEAATTVRVKAGGNAADTAAGAGAQSVMVEGLDGNGDLITETIATAGASASAATTALFFRIYRATVVNVGAYTGTNTAAITIEDSAGVSDLILIAAGEGQSQYGAYSVPNGYRAYILSIEVEADASKPADFRLHVRNNITDVTTPFSGALVKRYWDGVTGTSSTNVRSPLSAIVGLSDIWLDAEGSGAITEVSVEMEILLIKD